MADRKIEIQLATVGAAEAAAGVKQTTDAVKDLSATTDDSFSKMQAQVAADAEAAKARAVHHRERSNQAEEAANAQARELVATKENQQTQIDFMKSEVFGQMAAKLGEASQGIRKMAADFKESAPEIEAKLQGVADGIENVSAMAQSATLGFAVAKGPGAAVAAVVSLGGSAVSEALKELSVVTAQMMAGQEALDNFQEDLAVREIARAGRLREQGMGALFKEQAEDAKNLGTALAHLSQVQSAQDSLDTAKRDRSDRMRIEAGDNPAEVKNDRIQDDALDAKNRNNRAVAAKLSLRDQALGDSIEADAAASDAAGPGKDPDVAQRLAAAAAEKRKAAMAAAEDHQDAMELARIKNKEIDIRSTDAMHGVATKERDRIEKSQSHVGDNWEPFKEEQAKQQAKATREAAASTKDMGREMLAAMKQLKDENIALKRGLAELVGQSKNARRGR
jgi:hypothetical protein